MPFLSAKDIGDRNINIEVDKFVNYEDGLRFRKRCNPEYGDILIVSRGATIGRTAIMESEDIFCLLGSVILIKPLLDKIKPLLLFYFWTSSKAREEMLLSSDSSAQQAIYLTNISHFFVPMPPIPEQEIIVQFLEKSTSKIDHTISRIEKEIELMQEYRVALISEVVTGKVRVVV